MFRNVINIYVSHRLLFFPHVVHWAYVLTGKGHESFLSTFNLAMRILMLVRW